MDQEESDNFPEYVPIAEAAQLLGEKEARIFYYADRGDIAIEPGREGQRVRRYKVADILAVKQRRLERRRRAAAKKAKPDPVIYDWLKASDMPACLLLDKIVYKEDIDLGEASIYQSWRRKNLHISIAAFDARDRNICLGYIGLVPVVSEQICLDVLSGRRIDHSITVEEVDSYDHPGAYTLLAISACTHPDRPDLLYPMLYKHMEFWKSMYPERYIKKVFAQSVSESGDRLVQMLYMAPRPDLNVNAYELDLARPQVSRLLRQFKQELVDIAPLPDALRWPPVAIPVAPAPDVPRQEERKTQVHPVSSAVRSLVSDAESTTLPAGYRGFTEFFESHGIAGTTADRAAKAGAFQIIRGNWKVDGHPVKKALDADGQNAFIRHFRRRPGYHMCQVAGCVCLEYGSGGYLGDGESQ